MKFFKFFLFAAIALASAPQSRATCNNTITSTPGVNCLTYGQRVYSCNGCFYATLRYGSYTVGDYFWTIYKASTGQELWATNQAAMQATIACMMPDGDFELLSGVNPMWHTNTNGNPGATAQLQDNGAFTIISSSGATLYSNKVNAVCSTAIRDRIPSGSCLAFGQSVLSENGCYKLIFQNDGNLVVYKVSNNAVIFATNTANRNVNSACMKTYGNFEVSVVVGDMVFNYYNTRTTGSTGAYGQILNDGRFVIVRTDGSIAWSSGNKQYDC